VLARVQGAFGVAAAPRCSAACGRFAPWTRAALRGQGVGASRAVREDQAEDCNMLRIYDVMLDAIALIAPLIKAIERHDRNLANQMQRAASSVALNIAEGSGSSGGVRTARYRTALGSARETVCGLQVAERARYIAQIPRELIAKMNHVIGTLVRVAC
jgi:four helix bundle protein